MEQSKNYLPPEERPASFDWKAFSLEGLLIAREIKSQLPDWTVIYFDNGAHLKAVESGNHARDTYAYEVR
jgi:hypothetical protein